MKSQALFCLLSKRWVTAADSMRLCGLLALSQQVTRWERDLGLRFERKEIRKNGSRFLAYRLDKR
jgi:hypothetical protein